MNPWTRRGFLSLAGGGLAACTSSRPDMAHSPGTAIDIAVDRSLGQLYQNVPGAVELGRRAEGILVIPDIRRIGFFASGAYGEGALLIGPAKVEYYSLSEAAIGFTFGAAEFSQALFFMTPQALAEFRIADGWQLGLQASVVVSDDGAAAGIDTTRLNRPIYEVVFSQRGLLAGASLAGAKYSRIVR